MEQTIKGIVDPTIKERLDSLNVDVQGVSYKKTIKNNWSVYTNASGLKIAVYELDSPTAWKAVSATATNVYLCTTTLKENLPTSVFAEPPMISVSGSEYVGQCVFIAAPILPPSQTYIGELLPVMIDTAGNGTNKPTTVHFTITAIGI